MKWSIPAKTFFLGEYAAIAGAPAILLTTTPCFELTLTNEPGLQGIHPDSPAGQFWMQQRPTDKGLLWYDPYHGRGGMGASSAQWLGAWYASNQLQKKQITQQGMLDAYFQSAWQGVGVRPSGYDILAQSLHACVFIHRQQEQCETYAWPFTDLAFILVHTGEKLATHHHLQALTLTSQMSTLAEIVQSAKSAFESADSTQVIDAVNAYHQHLFKLDLVATHSLHLMELLQKNPDVLAIKGCGAMGADVLLMLVPQNRLKENCNHLRTMKMDILATSEDLYQGFK